VTWCFVCTSRSTWSVVPAGMVRPTGGEGLVSRGALTRWLRVGPGVFRVVPSDAAQCRFSMSCPLVQFTFCRLLLGGVSPLGRVSGTHMPGSVESSKHSERVVLMPAMAATASNLRPVVADVSVDETAGDEQVQGLNRGQTAAVVL